MDFVIDAPQRISVCAYSPIAAKREPGTQRVKQPQLIGIGRNGERKTDRIAEKRHHAGKDERDKHEESQ